MRLSLRQNKIKKTDDYKDSLGWTQNAGRVLSDAPKAVEPEIIIVQCEMCGSRLKIPKPKNTDTQFHVHTQNAITLCNLTEDYL